MTVGQDYTKVRAVVTTRNVWIGQHHLVECGICWAMIFRDRFDDHTAEAHPGWEPVIA